MRCGILASAFFIMKNKTRITIFDNNEKKMLFNIFVQQSKILPILTSGARFPERRRFRRELVGVTKIRQQLVGSNLRFSKQRKNWF